MSEDPFWSEFVTALHEGPDATEGTHPGELHRQSSLERLNELDRRYRDLVEALPLTTFVGTWEDTLRVRYVSPQIEALLGYPRERWLSDPPLWDELLHPEDRERALDECGRAWLERRPVAAEYRLVGRDGREVWVREQTAVPAEGTVAQGVWIDVTEQHEARRALEEERVRAEEYLGVLSGEQNDRAEPAGHLAFYDALTGLPNRALLEDRLERAVSDAREERRELVLLSVGLDAFRLVNDSLGHLAGDTVLCRIASRLRDLVGPADALGRPGGDEFLLMLGDPGEDPDEAALAMSERIARILAEPFSIDGAEFEVCATVGGSVFPRDARSADHLLKHADAAMYAAKEGGPGGFAVYSGGTLESFRRLSDTTRLRRALDGDELLLHYQPMYSLARGTVVSVEALLRWAHPDRGLMLPALFIPLAEETGLIEAIGEWVIGAIARQASDWLAEGLDPHISFNVSARQLRRRDLVPAMAERLGAAELDLSRFTMEITESALMHDPERAIPLITRLRELGLHLALDDFGAGFSSLARLRTLPVQVLKIDRSFLVGAPEDPEAAGLMSAAIALAEALGMEAVAEGVENEAQRRFLVERGCALAQGFHLARPMPAEAASSILPRRSPAER
jgi:diguanylate cyclase (GGDEF)-like protein/PAS domain S-box-containing protein